MGFNIINMATWARKDCFNHFFNNAKCTYSITVNIDITNLHTYIISNNLKLYPTFTWIVSRAVNNYPEFKMAFDNEGRLGYFDEIGPSYSVLNETTKVMSDLYTSFSSSFAEFYTDMNTSLANYKQNPNFTSNFKHNFFIVSCLPWLNYTSFNVNNEGSTPFLFPMITWGQFIEDNNKITMPVIFKFIMQLPMGIIVHYFSQM